MHRLEQAIISNLFVLMKKMVLAGLILWLAENMLPSRNKLLFQKEQSVFFISAFIIFLWVPNMQDNDDMLGKT